LGYEELAFHLEDSVSFRAFARLQLASSPKKSVLHQTISAIRPETWEAVNRALVASAKQQNLESGHDRTKRSRTVSASSYLAMPRSRCARSARAGCRSAGCSLIAPRPESAPWFQNTAPFAAAGAAAVI